jgi:hypothetical protein
MEDIKEKRLDLGRAGGKRDTIVLGTIELGGGKKLKLIDEFTNPVGGKPPKAQEPLLWTNRLMTDDRQLPAEELKYSCNRARRRQCPTNIMLVWQNLASFGGRPISGAVEALLTKVINR